MRDDQLRPAFVEASLDSPAGMLLVGRMDAKLDLLLAGHRETGESISKLDGRLRAVELSVVPRTEVTSLHSGLEDRIASLEKSGVKLNTMIALGASGISLLGGWVIEHIWK